MRKPVEQQMPLNFRPVNWGLEKDLETINNILGSSSEIYESAAQDLNREVRTNAGAKGMNAEQVVRTAVLKQLKDYSYKELADRISDSERFRCFTRFFDQVTPSASALQENIKKLSAQTWQKINEFLLKFARDKGIEDGNVARIDTTGVETNIHHPSDSSQLWDCCRVLTRIMCFVRANLAGAWDFHNHTRKAKKLRLAIQNAKSKDKRAALYSELLSFTSKTLGYARNILDQLSRMTTTSHEERLTVKVIKEELGNYIESTEKVIDVCRRRVLEDEKVPAEDKVVSIFEDHTDIIEKGNRETIFGHKISLTGGESNMILDCIIERGNPGDATLFPTAIDNHINFYGSAPEQVAALRAVSSTEPEADSGFNSEANARYARKNGVQDICFTSQPRVTVLEWVRSLRVFKKLRNFRAGIEGCISTMKRVLGLDRCTWRGFKSFCSYVWLTIVSFNLRVLASHLSD